MAKRRARPTRRDLLTIVRRLQNLIGGASAANNDRNQNRFAQVNRALTTALNLCIEARAFDPIDEPNKNGWGDDGSDRDWERAI